ncbi:baseplate protein [Aggregatibacter actinomycetemcomitans]|uniref:Baseplate protein n=3 Tax=Aggregatibacter actinomycetemcomitans TaxID=714 RepID=A0A5D0EL94_AGGAC|nr:Gp138 family membrane-puncturing spike protein [Aggregatibacter actinomycetemcomitans]NP_852773.1 baseplate spike [Haemophilus phage Aaphi23]AMQ94641.1 baseplate protein [Aggregatibacter actinomycetemcomitans]TYA21684.1 baseplate protein [Aggregatibacter actinomycetemcomitans]TYA34467.1 baseplate protein [Aggregatibacter actinomycetemcomitans]TYA39519.1 baseplate protein [Aggregatibacter actinomycetemcomitans]TYA41464.1 baseplate protein [Aggregatibacter actinomycetemcomitans]
MSYDQSLATPETATDQQIQQDRLNLHTALPAKVVSFDPAKQTVTLAVQIKMQLADGSGADIPPLVDVPVSFPRGGGFAVTFPLQAGDEGIAIFSERCIDGWWHSGGASLPLDFRLHDLSDAMFIPGVCSVPKAINGFFTGGLSMQTLDGGTYIRIVNGSIKIKGNIEHDGNTKQKGELHSTGEIISDTDVKAAGISGKSHTHRGDSGGTTGTPQ